MEEALAFRAIRRGISRSLSPATLSYHAEILTLAKKMLPDKRLSSLTENEILSIIGAATVGQSRRKAVFELVKGTFRRAKDSRQTDTNPLAGHVPGQVPPKDRELPTREQLDEIIAVVEDESPKWGRKAGLSIRFFAFSGMRRSEALTVESSDIGAKEIDIKGTKTARSDRRFQINPPLQDTLDEIAEVYGKEGLLKSPIRFISFRYWSSRRLPVLKFTLGNAFPSRLLRAPLPLHLGCSAP
jgi:integrase